jgi:hypothetical protein
MKLFDLSLLLLFKIFNIFFKLINDIFLIKVCYTTKL